MHPDAAFGDTIFALSSGQPPAAIAIVRISGSHAALALLALSGRVPPPRHASLVRLCDTDNGDVLDHALALFFPGPNSVTGEDMVELHLHGGRAVVTAVERALASRPGLRRAAPGEFTRRAFANGRLDLAEAEGLSDLLIAETEGQRRNAMALADGVLSRTVRQWRAELINVAAALEARIDFAEEDDVPEDDGTVGPIAASLRQQMIEMLTAPPAERLKDGIRVVLAGPTNAGKSSLLNALVGREAAITTPIAGTTRDLIEVPVQLGGLPFLFVDTAGLRETNDEVERIGVSRADRAAKSADIVLWLGEPDECPFTEALILHPRCDVAGRERKPDNCVLALSIADGTGLAALVDLLVSRGTSLLPRETELALAKRQRDALEDCVSALSGANSGDPILIAEALRSARAALDRLTGEGGIEPLLDAIFERFCIGK